MRTSIVAEIFGYLVCLIAVIVFFASIAGIVNSAFRVVNPTAGPRIIATRMLGGPGGPKALFYRSAGSGHGIFGHMFGHHGHAGGGPQTMGAAPLPMPSPPDIAAMRARAEGDARFDAVRRLVLAIVMLAVSIWVFRRMFDWLNPRQGSAA